MMKKLVCGVGVAAALAWSVTAGLAADRGSEKFIKEAIEGNYAEVEMGKLAQEKGQSQDVKSFGQTLVTDHSAANLKAASVATQLNVTPPSGPNAKQKKDHDKMAKMSGDKFDRAFAKHMVADHKKDIRDFEKAAKKANKKANDKANDKAGAFANETLPVLRKHLETAQSLAKRR